MRGDDARLRGRPEPPFAPWLEKKRERRRWVVGEGANYSSHGQRPWASLSNCLLSRVGGGNREGGRIYLAVWPHNLAAPFLSFGLRFFFFGFCLYFDAYQIGRKRQETFTPTARARHGRAVGVKVSRKPFSCFSVIAF